MGTEPNMSALDRGEDGVPAGCCEDSGKYGASSDQASTRTLGAVPESAPAPATNIGTFGGMTMKAPSPSRTNLQMLPASGGVRRPRSVNGLNCIQSYPCGTTFDPFDQQLPRPSRVPCLVEQHRFVASGNHLRYPRRQHNDIEDRWHGGGNDRSPALFRHLVRRTSQSFLHGEERAATDEQRDGCPEQQDLGDMRFASRQLVEPV